MERLQSKEKIEQTKGKHTSKEEKPSDSPKAASTSSYDRHNLPGFLVFFFFSRHTKGRESRFLWEREFTFNGSTIIKTIALFFFFPSDTG